MSKNFSLMMAGVGGQGLVLLSNIIGTAGAIAGIRVITGEQHGLSQRSGSIQVHLRVGPDVRSPLIPVGSADAILSLEALETLRYIEYLKDGGVAVINKRVMHPVGETGELVNDKTRQYMGLEQVVERVGQVTNHVLTLDALEVARRAGNALTENVALLGAISVLEEFPVPPEPLKGAVARMVPKKAVEVNLKAFRLGAEAARDRFCKELACRGD
ncbi:MAG: indolepyruvate ferredoxin oxidoreductase subunit beta [Euryarchaeota archaeon]|nr:indolepyruvate ferredoxin oxidoreductase subunit beta [Euryarchaeota archaeon]